MIENSTKPKNKLYLAIIEIEKAFDEFIWLKLWKGLVEKFITG